MRRPVESLTGSAGDWLVGHGSHCSLRAIGADGVVHHFAVRPLSTLVKTHDGSRLTIDTCGTAQPCSQATQSPTGSPSYVERQGACHAFGALPLGPLPPRPAMSLLSPHAPSRGVTLRYAGGYPCDGSSVRRSTSTFIVRCDASAHIPILKSLVLKEDCDLEVEIVAADGCPDPPWLATPSKGPTKAAASSALCLDGASGCTLLMLLDPACDPPCANDACFWDNGACFELTMGCAGCLPEWLHDGECDEECSTEACNWDSGDCITDDGRFVTSSRPRCLPGCPASWLGDGECDPACDTRACSFDDGDCAPGSCLLAVASPDRSLGGLDLAEAAMGGAAGAVNGAGPPGLAPPSVVWYDLRNVRKDATSTLSRAPLPEHTVFAASRMADKTLLVARNPHGCIPASCSPPFVQS